MENKFTEKAERVLNASVTIAQELGHTYIGSEHILLALTKDSISCSAVILGRSGVTTDKLEGAIREYSGVGKKSVLTAKDMTPRCRKIIENSYKNLLELQKVLPDEKQMKSFFDDYYIFQNHLKIPS